ncbi:MAG: hypothetical protein AAGF25_14190 [Pseudomonadota bacterium]
MKKYSTKSALAVIITAATLVTTGTAFAGSSANSMGLGNGLQERGFNPQPEPPAASGFSNPGQTRSFNPQPEPPARLGGGGLGGSVKGLSKAFR